MIDRSMAYGFHMMFIFSTVAERGSGEHGSKSSNNGGKLGSLMATRPSTHPPATQKTANKEEEDTKENERSFHIDCHIFVLQRSPDFYITFARKTLTKRRPDRLTG